MTVSVALIGWFQSRVATLLQKVLEIGSWSVPKIFYKLKNKKKKFFKRGSTHVWLTSSFDSSDILKLIRDYMQQTNPLIKLGGETYLMYHPLEASLKLKWPGPGGEPEIFRFSSGATNQLTRNRPSLHLPGVKNQSRSITFVQGQCFSGEDTFGGLSTTTIRWWREHQW